MEQGLTGKSARFKLSLFKRRSEYKSQLQFTKQDDQGKTILVTNFDNLGQSLDSTFPLLDANLT